MTRLAGTASSTSTDLWCITGAGVGVLQGSDVPDVFQEVFLAVSVHLPRFRRENPGDSFRGWLRTIVKNKVIDLVRNSQRNPVAAGGSDAYELLLQTPAREVDDESDPTAPDSRRALLHRCWDFFRDEFEEQTWRAFWKVTVEERSSTEVAAELNMTAGAVRKAKARVLHRLRKEFGDVL